MDNEIEAPFTIPESAYGILRDLVDMKPEDFESFMAGLKTAKPSISTASLSRHISRSASGVPRSVINAVVSEIMTLEYLKQDSEMTADEFAHGIAVSVIESEPEGFDFSVDDINTLSSRIQMIFSSDHVLQLNTKAISVLTDHEKLFFGAKILTDARPVFNDDGSAIEAMAIVHMLRIHFEQNQKHKDFVTALDVSDLRKLRSVIERAEKKAEVLQGFIKESGMSYLDIDQSNVGD